MTTPSDTDQLSSYLAYLPAVFQEVPGDAAPPFLGRFLLAFEHMLTGRGDPAAPGLEEMLDGIGTPDASGRRPLAGIERFAVPGFGLPDTDRTPREFLSWLAGWLALRLREDWTDDQKRQFISQIVPLYRLRGTKEGLQQLLAIHTGMGVTISEFHEPLQVGDPVLAGKPGGAGSTLGVDTLVGGAPPYYFLVKFVYPSTAAATELESVQKIAHSIIDQEKPAHTWYDLLPDADPITVGRRSTVGVNTLLVAALRR